MNKLTVGEKAEIEDLYDGSASSVRELAILFRVSPIVIRYFVDYDNCRAKSLKLSMAWRKKNPKKWAEMNNRAVKKWYANNPEKLRVAMKKRYLENPEKYKRLRREYYHKSKIKR